MTQPAGAEPTTDPAGGGEPGGNGDSYTPPASQEELNRIIAERVNRTKAQFKDYNDLKAKASRLDEIERANQTEAERLNQQLQQMQERLQQATTTAVRARVEALAAGDFATPADAPLVVGDLSQYVGEDGQIDDAAITAKLAEELAKRPTWRREQGPRTPVPNHAQGSSSNGAALQPNDHMNALIRGARGA